MAGIDQIVYNYLRGKSSEEEQDILLDYLRASSQNQEHFENKKRIFQNDEAETFTLQEWEAWQKIKSSISEQKNVKTSPPASRMLYKVASVAAIIVFIALLFGIPVLQKQKVIVSTNPGQTIKMVLPDSSSVILNSSSSMEYHPFTFMMKREIDLEGEAYFCVRKKRNVAFRVQSDDMEVKVYGTRFNVNTYSQNDHYSVVLEEGTVKIKLKESKTRPVKLCPGQIMEISRGSEKYNVKKVNTRLYTSWKEGLLYFYDSSFRDVINRIAIRYGAQMKIEDEIVSTFVLSTTIRDESLEKVLDLFKKVLPIKISEKSGLISIELDEERYKEFIKKRQ